MTRRDLRCHDCLRDTSSRGLSEYYMLQDEVWDRAASAVQTSQPPEPRQWTNVYRDGALLCTREDRQKVLCVGCVEDRLGRRLAPDDFTDCPVNDGIYGLSFRLRDRMGRP